MNVSTDSFAKQVFSYIDNQYGNSVLKQVQSDTNKTTVARLLGSSINQKDTVDHAANKVIAMLRINP
jgi:hypothetical protein